MTNHGQRQDEDAPAEQPLAPGRRALGPASEVARRTRSERRAARGRPYPLPLDATDPTDATGDAVRLAATRALLFAESREEVAAVLHTAVNDLGAGVVPARIADMQPHAMPLDVSLGVGEPRVVVVDPLSMAAMRCSHQLPGLVEDAQLAAGRCDRWHRNVARASVDESAGGHDDRDQP